MSNKPNIVVDGDTKTYKCPKCEHYILSTCNMSMSGIKMNFCPNCGAFIDWIGITLDTYWRA